jgi:hypothetical protein
MVVHDNQTLNRTLGWVLDSEAFPAAYCVWCDPVMRLDLPYRSSTATVFGSDGGDLLGRLPNLASQSAHHGVVVLRDWLSALAPVEKRSLDVQREQLLRLDKKLIFVESTTQERAIRRELPNVISIVREHFRLVRPSWDDDDMWPAAAEPWDRFAARLPKFHSHGSILYIDGKAHFKAGPVDACPKCGARPVRGTTQITFRYAPAETRDQQVVGWVCPCGEAYVPGDVAREAHRRAFSGVDS